MVYVGYRICRGCRMVIVHGITNGFFFHFSIFIKLIFPISCIPLYTHIREHARKQWNIFTCYTEKLVNKTLFCRGFIEIFWFDTVIGISRFDCYSNMYILVKYVKLSISWFWFRNMLLKASLGGQIQVCPNERTYSFQRRNNCKGAKIHR